nr:hypothetical protein [Tanacetum cinerariifolium]
MHCTCASCVSRSLGESILAIGEDFTSSDAILSLKSCCKLVGLANLVEPVTTVSTPITTAIINITTVEPVTTVSTPITIAGVSVSTAEPSTPPPTTTTIIEDEDLIIAQTLMKMKSLQDKKKEANIALIAEWDDVQAMMDADHELAERLQAEELRAEERRIKQLTKAQKRNQMCLYLKNMAVKDRAEGSETRAERSSKRARKELESDKSKKQKLNEKVEAEVDSDQEEAEMKMYMKIVSDDEIAIDAIPLATKPPIIVDWKIIKEGKISSYHIIRADGSSKRYSLMIQMLQHIDREDLETLWKLAKAKYGNTRPEEAYERVLWGDLKVMFEPDIESAV